MSQKRQQLIDAAMVLFAQRGFHATGIDLIAERAQVSKKTLYHHFRSKEELILAVLRHNDSLFRNFFMKAVEQSSGEPKMQLLAIFDVAHQWFSQKEFFGCIFINAIGEYSAHDSHIRKACQDYKSQMSGFIKKIATEAGAAHPQDLASSLFILLEGSIVTAQVAGNPDSAGLAKNAARILINNAFPDNSVDAA